MPLEEFMFPNERVEFSTLPELDYAGDKRFQFFITNQRVILFARRGLIFKRDHIISRAISEIAEIAYKEKGILKRGYLFIKSEKGNLELKGKTETIKEITKILQNKLETRQFNQKISPPVQVNVQSPVLQKEVHKEIVMIPCKYCGSMMPQTSAFCPNCGARRKS